MTPSNRRRVWRALGAPVVACAVGMVHSDAAWAQTASPNTSVVASDRTGDAAIVWNRSATLAERMAAADRLLTDPSAEARALVAQILQFVPADLPTVEPDTPSAAGVMLTAVTAQSNAAPWLLEPLSAAFRARADTLARQEPVVEAVSSIRTREAVRFLIEAGKPGPNGAMPLIADSVFRGLVRQTGRVEFGTDLNRWSLWFGTVQWMPEAEWRRTLAEGLAGYADSLKAERDGAVTHLVDSLRQQYLKLDTIEERSNMLAELMRDPKAEIRAMGLLTAKQELANARQLSPVIARAAADRLLEPSAPVRRAAAELIAILGSDEDLDKVASALLVETDASVAALLLKFIARSPRQDLAPILVNWLEAGSPTVQPACDATEAAYRAGYLADSLLRSRVVAVLRAWQDKAGEMPSSGIRLAWALGDDADRTRLTMLLTQPPAERRRSAALALAGEPEAVEAILGAARADPALAPAAAQALVKSRRTQVGYRQLLELPGLDPAARLQALVELSLSLSHQELVTVAMRTTDMEMRESLLARLATEPLEEQVEVSMDPTGLSSVTPWDSAWSNRSQNPWVVSGLLMLCDVRMALKQPAGALAALDALLPASKTMEAAEYNERRLKTLLWLDRIDDAEKLDVSASAWLDGMEQCVTLPHGRQVIEAFEARFPEPRDDSIETRLAGLRARVRG